MDSLIPNECKIVNRIVQFEKREKKERKLCTDELGGVKMKKNEKQMCFAI
jgi:hypothetical protein